MTYTCIGKRRGQHGEILPCTNTSEKPTNAERPDWGFLCTQCSGSPVSRKPLTLDLPDMDNPDMAEFAADLDYYPLDDPRNQSDIEQDELDNLQELDL